jgi:hypothetical protein
MHAHVVHCKRDPYDVYIGRPSRWGNPYSHLADSRATAVVDSRDKAIAAYRIHLWAQVRDGEVTLEDLAELHGKTLGCWCAPKACHGEVLVAAAAWAVAELERDQVESPTGQVPCGTP